MTLNRNMPITTRSTLRVAATAGCIALLSCLGHASDVRADSVNSPNITLNVDTNRATGTGNGAGNTSVTINTITIAETMLPEYSSGAGKSISIKVKPGYQFDPTSNVTAQSATIGFNALGVNVAASITPTGAADETLTFNLTSGTNTGVQDIIRINGIKLRILSAAGAAGPAQTTMNLTTSTCGGAFTNQGVVAANITKGLPDRLELAVQPGSTQAGSDLLPAIKIVDFGGNLITADARTISLTLQANPGSASLLGTTSHDTANGVATWVDADDLRLLVASDGYTLRAAHSGANFLTSDTVDSLPFNISAGAPNSLVVTQQPVATAAGADILLAVTVKDSLNNTVTAATNPISIEAAINPGGWPLLTATSLTKTPVNGVATWADADDLRITKAIEGYRLAVSGVGATVFTDAFNITPGDPAQLRFVQQPTTTAQNATMNPAVTVEILDAFNNRTTSTATVALALGTAPCGGTVAGGSTPAVSGVATFSALSIDTACAGDILEASSGNLNRTSSDPFTVTAVETPNNNACGLCGGGAFFAAVPMLLAQMWAKRRYRERRWSKPKSPGNSAN